MRVLKGDVEVARHARCWGRRRVVELPAHRQALIELKRGARAAKGQDGLRTAVPGIDALFARWVNAGRNVGSLTARTVTLLDRYGEATVAAAVTDVLARGTHDPGAIASSASACAATLSGPSRSTCSCARTWLTATSSPTHWTAT